MNRNFPVFWGPDGTSDDGDSEIYHGTHPASEPEVQAVVNYYNSLPNKVTALEVHTCSQLLLYPFSGKPEFPAQPDLDNYRAISYKMAETIAKLRNTKYVVANIYNDLYPSAGCAADFFYMPDNSTRTAYALAVELSPTMVDSAEQCFILDDAEIEPVGKEITPAFLDFIEFGSSNPLVNSR
ncbi:Zn-dependent exopeptidase [Ramicandelaber brevisporus]|nr:Zn-dependent exopeptidase [Ramicandelaber brevisporus]